MHLKKNVLKFDLSIISLAIEVNEDLLRCIESCKFSKITVEHILVIPFKEQHKTKGKFKGKNFKLVYDNGKGVYSAINEGLKFIDGRKILILHGDNYISIDGSKIIENNISENQTIQYGSNIKNCNNKQKPFINVKVNFINLLLGLYPPHPGLVIDEKDFINLGFYSSEYKICSDFDYYLRLYRNRIRVKYLKSCIIISPSGGISSSGLTSILSIAIERFKILKKYYWFLSPILPITITIGYGIKLFHRYFLTKTF